jgi:hypothetical protein
MQPDVVSALLRVGSVQWNGIPVAYVAVLGLGGLLYLVMSMSTRSATTKAPVVRRPGWLARRRARGGIRHPKTGTAIGYGSAVHQVGLSGREMELGGLILGGPGAGKTSAITKKGRNVWPAWLRPS